MKIWLDDIRQPPDDSWMWCKSASDFTATFTSWHDKITEISFDHDIASYNYVGDEITGYHMFCVVEKHAFVHADYTIPKMHCHSSNGPGRKKITLGIERLKERFHA